MDTETGIISELPVNQTAIIAALTARALLMNGGALTGEGRSIVITEGEYEVLQERLNGHTLRMRMLPNNALEISFPLPSASPIVSVDALRAMSDDDLAQLADALQTVLTDRFYEILSRV